MWGNEVDSAGLLKSYLSKMHPMVADLDEAAREYFALHPENGLLFNFGLLSHPRHKFLAGSPDRVTQNGILIEIKVSTSPVVVPVAADA